MKVVEVGEENFETLQPEWERLLRDSGSNTIFLSWEWIAAWWASYGTPGSLRILAAFDEGNVLRGIAPLRLQQMRRCGQLAPALSFIGDGSNDSDYLDFIIARGCEGEVMKSFFTHLAPELKRGTVLLLNDMPESSSNLHFLREEAERRRIDWTESEIACATVNLPRTWEGYLAKLRPRFRTKVRSVLRHLEGRADMRFGFCTDCEQARLLLPALFDLHKRRWSQEGKPGVFGTDAKRAFYLALSSRLMERGWLRFSWLEWNGRILACQYGFAYSDTYYHLQEGYEPESEHWNVGIGLRAWTIQQFLNEGIAFYDFLGGMGRHKSDWGAEKKVSKHLQVAMTSYKNVLFCRGPHWAASGRESLAKVLPEAVLSARRARLARKLQAKFVGSDNGPESFQKQWVRKAAANFYLYSGFPTLTRQLRERYELSISTKGGRAHLACSKKTAPTARILYYHRVNDEQDPFFPAISTKLFEQEMQFAAKHYKVVSLRDLLTHLGDAADGDVLAVTFDDGYRDNYENAFPILHRYGLPATVFLTTGCMDSGEPLWFERLAHALRTTLRDFVDVEIDLPRRFWTRTEAERLAAQNSIFGLLRGLDDAERRRWLDNIFHQLEVVDYGSRKDKMLTWDQVRLMHKHGIDFGGHTVSHPFLSRMTQDQAIWEVSECKRRIEEELQTEVAHFAYPNGREEDFGQWNKELLRKAGYKAAVTTIWGKNYRSTDPMELRRGQPWEDSPALFAYKLDWYQLVNG